MVITERSSMEPIMISRDSLKSIVGLSYPTILRLEKTGEFPHRKQLTSYRVGWLYAEVVAWANSRINSPSQV